MIEFNRIFKRYSAKQEVLSDVNFKIKKGEMVFLTGHSGAGKTTILKLAACLERPTQGTIIVNNRDYSNIDAGDVPVIRRKIGLIFQNPHLLLDRNVFENVSLPLYIAGFTTQESARRVRAALNKVGLLHKERALPETLSCGEQQRVNIARAIVSRPPLILADEPTGNLDPDLAQDIMQLFKQFNQLGITLLVVTHDLNLIQHSKYQHRALILKEGKIVL